MEGVLERAWNHPPLDKCLELVEDSTERSTRGVTERWARGFLVFGLTECTKRYLLRDAGSGWRLLLQKPQLAVWRSGGTQSSVNKCLQGSLPLCMRMWVVPLMTEVHACIRKPDAKQPAAATSPCALFWTCRHRVDVEARANLHDCPRPWHAKRLLAAAQQNTLTPPVHTL